MFLYFLGFFFSGWVTDLSFILHHICLRFSVFKLKSYEEYTNASFSLQNLFKKN